MIISLAIKKELFLSFNIVLKELEIDTYTLVGLAQWLERQRED